MPDLRSKAERDRDLSRTNDHNEQYDLPYYDDEPFEADDVS